MSSGSRASSGSCVSSGSRASSGSRVSPGHAASVLVTNLTIVLLCINVVVFNYQVTQNEKYSLCDFFLWQIFDSELENLLEYNGFNDWLHSFPLYRGKKTSEDDDDDHRIVGKFKVLLSFRMLNLYAWCLGNN